MFSVAEKLPKFWALSTNIAAQLRAGNFPEWDVLIESMSPLLQPDFVVEMEKLVPGWRKISDLHNGLTAKHTLLVVASCLNVVEYQQADWQTQREIEWAAVLHDIDKEQARGDPSHPFRSAAVAVGSMLHLGFPLQPGSDASDVGTWSALVMSAQRQREDGRKVHDHTHLTEIVDGIHRQWGRETPESRIVKSVLFHQSLPTLKDWPNAVLMTDDELRYSLSLQDMEVLGTVMIGDSDSWNIFDEPRAQYLTEIRVSNAETRQRIQGVLETA